MQISTIGIDLAKTVFQVHGVDGCWEAVLRKQLRRRQMPEFFGMEACATSHHWARELRKLAHEVRLAELRQGLCQTRQERCGRCRGDLRGGNAAVDALGSDQERRAAGPFVSRLSQLKQCGNPEEANPDLIKPMSLFFGAQRCRARGTPALAPLRRARDAF